MEENEKNQIMDSANKTIDKVADALNINGSEAREFVGKLDESDLKVIKELEDIITMFKKPFWKIVLGIIIVSSLVNLFYVLGTIVGQLIAKF